MWDVLLREGPEGDLGVPAEANDVDKAPGFIMLKDGGVVVLVYDSILIIASQGVIDGFYQRITRNMEEINLKLKYLVPCCIQ